MSAGVQAALTLVGYGESGLDIPPDLSYKEWSQVGRALTHMEASLSWWLGDWWCYGERAYGEAASAALPAGFALSTIQGAAWVADRFEPSRRRSDLPFSHHKEVAALPPAQADALLEEAAKHKLPREVLRKKVRRIRTGEGGLPAPRKMYVAATPGRGTATGDVLVGCGVDVVSDEDAHRVGVMADCDACLLVLPADRAAHFDYGWFVGRGRRTAVLASVIAVEGDRSVYRHADVVASSLDDLLVFFGLHRKAAAVAGGD